jgi:S1-C subfamily serine protease
LKSLWSDLKFPKPVLGALSRSGPNGKIGGVAPAVHPRTRWDRFREGRLLERRGFIPLSPARAKRRHRILPRTVIGISFMLLALAVGAAFAGAGFYAYYDNRLAANEQEIARFVEGFDEQFVDASESLDELRGESLEQIRQELQPLGEYVIARNGVVNLPNQVGSSVYQLRTANEKGTAVAGSAAAVAKHQGGTVFVTSYTLVKSGTIAPGPSIELIKGDEKITATLWSWDPGRDLALVVVDADIPRLEFADATELTGSLGARVFAISGTGAQGASASPGTVLDRSEVGLQHTAAVGELFNGGPLVSSEGKLVGIASTSYAPLGFAGGDVRFAPDLAGLCSRLLNCADPVDPEIGQESGG